MHECRHSSVAVQSLIRSLLLRIACSKSTLAPALCVFLCDGFASNGSQRSAVVSTSGSQGISCRAGLHNGSLREASGTDWFECLGPCEPASKALRVRCLYNPFARKRRSEHVRCIIVLNQLFFWYSATHSGKRGWSPVEILVDCIRSRYLDGTDHAARNDTSRHDL